MGEEIISVMAEWRQQNPKATFREVEVEGFLHCPFNFWWTGLHPLTPVCN